MVIKGEVFWLWRTVDADGNVLNMLMQKCRDKRAAMKFFHKLLRSQGFVPRVMVIDKLKSYGATKKELLPNTEQRKTTGANIKKAKAIALPPVFCPTISIIQR